MLIDSVFATTGFARSQRLTLEILRVSSPRIAI